MSDPQDAGAVADPHKPDADRPIRVALIGCGVVGFAGPGVRVLPLVVVGAVLTAVSVVEARLGLDASLVLVLVAALLVVAASSLPGAALGLSAPGSHARADPSSLVGDVARARELQLALPAGVLGVLVLAAVRAPSLGWSGIALVAVSSGLVLLRTLVTGLVLTHSPADLTLVLVDFKGGATFAGLEVAVGVLTTDQEAWEWLAWGPSAWSQRERDALGGRRMVCATWAELEELLPTEGAMLVIDERHDGGSVPERPGRTVVAIRCRLAAGPGQSSGPRLRRGEVHGVGSLQVETKQAVDGVARGGSRRASPPRRRRPPAPRTRPACARCSPWSSSPERRRRRRRAASPRPRRGRPPRWRWRGR